MVIEVKKMYLWGEGIPWNILECQKWSWSDVGDSYM